MFIGTHKTRRVLAYNKDHSDLVVIIHSDCFERYKDRQSLIQ